MMKVLLQDELRTLTSTRCELGLSIYLPTLRGRDGAPQNAIRLKNLIRAAEHQLEARELRSAEVRKWLEPVRRLAEERPFWQDQEQGLAIFVSDQVLRILRLPEPVPEMVTIGSGFHLKPLLPILPLDREFYILALSQNRVRLLHGTGFGVGEVEVAGMPHSLAEALNIDETGRQILARTGTPRNRGSAPSAVFYGLGSDDASDKGWLLQYFRRIDHEFRAWLGGRRVPVVLAGVSFLFPIYREASDLPDLMPEAIAGNPDLLPQEQLRDEAWRILQPRLEQDREYAAAVYRELAGTGRTADVLAELVPAAVQGRIQRLLLDFREHRWGRYDPETEALEVHPVQEPGDQDLLDFCAIQTFLNGGEVMAAPASIQPPAAVLRY
jgi:hypothetical protein